MNFVKSLIVSAAAVVSLAGLMPATAAFAANPANFSLSPSAGSVATNQAFDVYISEDGDSVNTVTVKLSYDASVLRLDSVSGNLSGGSIAEANGVTTYTQGGTSASVPAQVATAHFTALANTGSSSIAIAPGSSIYAPDSTGKATNIWSGVLSSTSVQVAAPAPQPAPSQGSTSTSTGGVAPAPRRVTTGTTSVAPTTQTETPAPVTTQPNTETNKKKSDTKETVLGANTSNTAQKAGTPWVLMAIAVAVVAVAAVIVRRYSSDIALEAADPVYAVAGARGSVAKKRPAASKAAGAAKARQAKTATNKK